MGAEIVNEIAACDTTHADSRNIDAVAAKRLLFDMRERLENFTCELRNLYVAMDGPPGTVSALAAELLDQDMTAGSSRTSPTLPYQFS